MKKGMKKTWRSGPPSGSPGRDVLLSLYEGERLSYEAIARRYGVTRTTVCKWIKAAGIPPRNFSEAAQERWKWDSASDALREHGRRVAPHARKGITKASYDKMVETRKLKGVNFATGPDSPMWRGGKTLQRERAKWAGIAKARYRRDKWTCADCGSVCLSSSAAEAAGNHALRVQAHHVIPRRSGGTDDLENLVTLCLGCHIRRERRYADALFA